MFFGEFGEDFSVQPDAGFFELIYKFTVRKTGFIRQLADGGVYFDIPKRAEISFLFSAVAKSVNARVQEGFLGGALFGFSLPAKTLGLPQYFSAAF